MVAFRTVAGLIALALCLAGCGAPGDAAAPPVFVEPSTAGPTTAAPQQPAATKAAKESPEPEPSKEPVKYVFPVRAGNVAFHPTHSKYPATDIFADCGATVVATTSGVIAEISLKDTYVKGEPDGPLNGGLSVSLLGDDGVRYYGSHLSKVQPGIEAGVRVTAGRQLGRVGHTGNANNVCHLHFGISPQCAKTGDWKVRRGVIWPADYLTSWRKKGTKSPVAEVARWKKAHDCKA